jgi:hypothetical protein
MKNIASTIVVASAVHGIALAAPAGLDDSLDKRLENGLGRTPALGYNNWVGAPLKCGFGLADRMLRTTAAALMLVPTRPSKLLI